MHWEPGWHQAICTQMVLMIHFKPKMFFCVWRFTGELVILCELMHWRSFSPRPSAHTWWLRHNGINYNCLIMYSCYLCQWALICIISVGIKVSSWNKKLRNKNRPWFLLNSTLWGWDIMSSHSSSILGDFRHPPYIYTFVPLTDWPFTRQYLYCTGPAWCLLHNGFSIMWNWIMRHKHILRGIAYSLIQMKIA